MDRYNTVLRWFEEYGFKIKKKDGNLWHETIMEDTKGNQRTFEITNNNIWFMQKSKGRTSFGKTKTELYQNLKKRNF